MALRTPTKGQPLGTYNRSTREPHRVKGFKVQAKSQEEKRVRFWRSGRELRTDERYSDF